MGQLTITKYAENTSGLCWVTASHRTLLPVTETSSLGPNPFHLPPLPTSFQGYPLMQRPHSGVRVIPDLWAHDIWQ